MAQSAGALKSMLAPGDGVVQPGERRVVQPLQLNPRIRTAKLVTTVGTRADFESQGTIAYNYGFEDFPTDEAGFGYPPNPWTTNGVTYNPEGHVPSVRENIVVASYSSYRTPTDVFCNNYWSPLDASIESGHNMLAFDVGMLGTVSSVTITLTTNQGTYVYSETAVPHWTEGGSFAGFIATGDGEYFTGLHLASAQGSGSAPCVDNVTLATKGTQTTEEVPAGEAATVTVEEDGQAVAGVDIQEDTFAEDVIVTVRLETVAEGGVCHKYLVGQYGRCLEIDITKVGGGDPIFLKPIVAGLCLDAQAPLELYKFEDDAAPPRPLREVAADFLECEGFEVASAKPRNWLEGLAMGVTKRVGKWITPKSAYAADMGFGGFVDDGHTSFFTWASPIQLGISGLAVNVFHSGKDAFGVTGKFASVPNTFVPPNGFMDVKGFAPEADEKGFNPAAHAITVQYGEFIQTLNPGQLKLSNFTKRWTYISGASVGINYLDIHPVTGAFTIAGRTPTYTALGLERPFTIRVGSRIRGGRLFCGTNGLCVLEH